MRMWCGSKLRPYSRKRRPTSRSARSIMAGESSRGTRPSQFSASPPVCRGPLREAAALRMAPARLSAMRLEAFSAIRRMRLNRTMPRREPSSPKVRMKSAGVPGKNSSGSAAKRSKSSHAWRLLGLLAETMAFLRSSLMAMRREVTGPGRTARLMSWRNSRPVGVEMSFSKMKTSVAKRPSPGRQSSASHRIATSRSLRRWIRPVRYMALRLEGQCSAGTRRWAMGNRQWHKEIEFLVP